MDHLTFNLWVEDGMVKKWELDGPWSVWDFHNCATVIFPTLFKESAMDASIRVIDGSTSNATSD